MQFEDTPWSLILRAKEARGDDVRDALEKLFSMYWRPLYVYVRRSGRSVDEAQDTVQGFVEAQLNRDFLSELDPERGRFRSYLLTAISNFMRNEWSSASRLKRGSGQRTLPLNVEAGEQAVSALFRRPDTPEQAFEREWALVLIQRALDATREHYARSDSNDLFDTLRPYISTEQPRRSYAELAQELATTESAVKSAIFRLRGQFRDAVRREVRRVVDDPDDEDAVNAEIQYLMRVLSP